MMPSTGIVAIKLWSVSKKTWKLIIMDDYLVKSKVGPALFGVNPSGKLKNNYWYPFLEKAFAKYVGKIRIPADESRIAMEKILGSSLQKYVTVGFQGNNNSFNQLESYFKNGSAIVLISRLSGDYCGKNRIQCGHAYAVLDLQANVANSGFSFLKVHNPTGGGLFDLNLF